MPPPWGRGVPGNRWDLVAAQPAVERTVSVVVAHYDQPEQLARTLTALRRQTWPQDLLEIVVADDGSPRTPVVPDGVRLVRQDDRGFRLAAVRNLGVTASSGDLLCFLDADTAPEPTYVERLVRLPSLLPEAVTVGRRRHADLAGTDPAEQVAAAAARHPLPEPSWLADAYRRSRNLLDADDRSYRFVIGAVTACSRWFFDRVGGFDETFESYGGEDWEWASRAWTTGAVLAHVDDAVAWHDGPEWAGRDEAEARRRKNAETLTLAGSIGVAGSRPHALIAPRTDVVVELASAAGPAAAFVAVDSMLAALPQARVVVPREVLDVFAADPRVVAEADERARVTVLVPTPQRVTDPVGLRAAVADVLAEPVDASGAPLGTVDLGGVVTVSSGRARLRERRWGEDAGWRREARPAPGLLPVPDEPDLEAYLGGWG
ncbi:glycosyltransferase [Serinibacter arcticus]|uniref:Glycosyltransferase n=1 Tax=Serinibacter arcticus TaxID=1655435 RepID=A0A2U1ZZC9_9MICO|nr:glycosyltransferase [Serinibacter arcticus]